MSRYFVYCFTTGLGESVLTLPKIGDRHWQEECEVDTFETEIRARLWFEHNSLPELRAQLLAFYACHGKAHWENALSLFAQLGCVQIDTPRLNGADMEHAFVVGDLNPPVSSINYTLQTGEELVDAALLSFDYVTAGGVPYQCYIYNDAGQEVGLVN